MIQFAGSGPSSSRWCARTLAGLSGACGPVVSSYRYIPSASGAKRVCLPGEWRRVEERSVAVDHLRRAGRGLGLAGLARRDDTGLAVRALSGLGARDHRQRVVHRSARPDCRAAEEQRVRDRAVRAWSRPGESGQQYLAPRRRQAGQPEVEPQGRGLAVAHGRGDLEHVGGRAGGFHHRPAPAGVLECHHLGAARGRAQRASGRRRHTGSSTRPGPARFGAGPRNRHLDAGTSRGRAAGQARGPQRAPAGRVEHNRRVLA